MTTVLTAILFLTAFQKIEGVNFKGGFFWAFIIAFCSLFMTWLHWTYQILKLLILTVCTLGIYLIFYVKGIMKVGLAKYMSDLFTWPMRFIAEQFPEQLSFDSEEARQKLAACIFGLTFLVPFTLG